MGGCRESTLPQTRMGVEQVYVDYFQRAKEYDAQWKRYNALPSTSTTQTKPPRYDIEMATLAEILDKKRFISCHSYVQSEINMLMKVAEKFGFTVNTFTHILEGYKVADKMAAHGAGGSTFSDWWAYKYEVKDAIPVQCGHHAQPGGNRSHQHSTTAPKCPVGSIRKQVRTVKYGGL